MYVLWAITLDFPWGWSQWICPPPKGKVLWCDIRIKSSAFFLDWRNRNKNKSRRENCCINRDHVCHIMLLPSRAHILRGIIQGSCIKVSEYLAGCCVNTDSLLTHMYYLIPTKTVRQTIEKHIPGTVSSYRSLTIILITHSPIPKLVLY